MRNRTRAELALRLDVDVAGTGVVGVLQHELDGIDDVLVARFDLVLGLHLDQLLEIAQVDTGGEVFLGPLDRVPQAVELVDCLENVGLGGDHQPELTLRKAAERVEALHVEGVGAGHLQLSVDHLEGDHSMAASEGPRHAGLDEVGIEAQGIDAHELEVGVGGDRPADVLLGDDAFRAVAASEAQVLHQLVGDGALLEGAGIAQLLRQQLGLTAQLGRLLGCQDSLALQDLGNQVGGQVHSAQ